MKLLRLFVFACFALIAAPLAAQPKLDLPAPDRAAIRTIIESLGGEIATPAEARAMLGLYQGLAYDRGRWGAAFKRLGL